MTTIDEILKFADMIGKEPGKEQDQQTINKLKIAMRFAISQAQKWIPVEEPPKVCDFYLCKRKDKINPIVLYYDGDYNYFSSSRGVQEFDVIEWRQIDLK